MVGSGELTGIEESSGLGLRGAGHGLVGRKPPAQGAALEPLRGGSEGLGELAVDRELQPCGLRVDLEAPALRELRDAADLVGRHVADLDVHERLGLHDRSRGRDELRGLALEGGGVLAGLLADLGGPPLEFRCRSLALPPGVARPQPAWPPRRTASPGPPRPRRR